jgi:predicted RNA-binding protein Jag
MERRDRRPREENDKITQLVKKVEDELANSLTPSSLTGLNADERRLVHRYFDRSDEFSTKTYKIAENEYDLRVYPKGNLRRLAEKSAEQAIQTGSKVALPPMSSYERFICHEVLKSNEAVKSESHGEGAERHIEIEPELYGRGMKKMIKRIKLF